MSALGAVSVDGTPLENAWNHSGLPQLDGVIPLLFF
jgi:hypothetical protein